MKCAMRDRVVPACLLNQCCIQINAHGRGTKMPGRHVTNPSIATTQIDQRVGCRHVGRVQGIVGRQQVHAQKGCHKTRGPGVTKQASSGFAQEYPCAIVVTTSLIMVIK